jgi:hypothetical protein
MAKSLLKVISEDGTVSMEFEENAGKLVQKYNNAVQVVKIADPTGGATVDAESRTAINAIIDALEAAGISADV